MVHRPVEAHARLVRDEYEILEVSASIEADAFLAAGYWLREQLDQGRERGVEMVAWLPPDEQPDRYTLTLMLTPAHRNAAAST